MSNISKSNTSKRYTDEFKQQIVSLANKAYLQYSRKYVSKLSQAK